MAVPRHDDDFDALMARLRAGDDMAATAVFRQFVDRLIALASSRFEPWMRHRVDVEGIVNSAYKSFFARHERGAFDLGDWDDLWALLAYITVRKCGKRRRGARAAARDAAREVAAPSNEQRLAWAPDRAPTPDETAMCADLVEGLFQAMSPEDRPVIELVLMGHTADETARRLDCSERTVRRVRERARSRLRRLLDAGPPA